MAGSELFCCPVDGCVKVFKLHSNLENHLTCGKCTLHLEKKRGLLESPTGNQYSRNTSHVKQYIREGDPTLQQGSDSVSTPPTPQQELDPVPSPYQPTVPESTAGLLDRGECPNLQENGGVAPEPSRNLRPQRTRRLPERLRDYVVNFLW